MVKGNVCHSPLRTGKRTWCQKGQDMEMLSLQPPRKHFYGKCAKEGDVCVIITREAIDKV